MNDDVPSISCSYRLIGVVASMAGILMALIAGIYISSRSGQQPTTQQPGEQIQAAKVALVNKLPTEQVQGIAVPYSTTTPVLGRIPGLQPADIKANLEQRDFTCSAPDRGKSYYVWTCTRSEATYNFMVEFYARTLGTVDYINASAMQYDSPSDKIASPFLGFIATMPYDNAAPDDARAWVEKTIPTLKGKGDVREESFGEVRYELFGIPTARNLRIGWLE